MIIFTPEIMDLNKRIALQFNNRCVIDFKPYNHMHHILPKSLGGKDIDENKVPLCAECHDKVHSSGNTLYWIRFLRKLRDRRLEELG
jgi:5-methylcytosine-specific restriction endonuclease McrA